MDRKRNISIGGSFMPTCQNCLSYFPNWVNTEQGTKNLSSRKYCLVCSPWGCHNTKPIKKPANNTSTRRCPRCRMTLPLDQFYRRRGQHAKSAYCKQCTNQQTTERTRETKRLAVEYKGGKCEVCGYNRCYGALDFHHANPEEKDFTISTKKCKSLDSIKAELDKCILVCCVCHAEIEAGIIPCPALRPRSDSNQ